MSESNENIPQDAETPQLADPALAAGSAPAATPTSVMPAEVEKAAWSLVRDSEARHLLSHLQLNLNRERLQPGQPTSLSDSLKASIAHLPEDATPAEKGAALADKFASLLVPDGARNAREVMVERLGGGRALLAARHQDVTSWDAAHEKHRSESDLPPALAELAATFWTILEAGARPDGRARDLNHAMQSADALYAAYLQAALSRGGTMQELAGKEATQGPAVQGPTRASIEADIGREDAVRLITTRAAWGEGKEAGQDQRDRDAAERALLRKSGSYAEGFDGFLKSRGRNETRDLTDPIAQAIKAGAKNEAGFQVHLAKVFGLGKSQQKSQGMSR